PALRRRSDFWWRVDFTDLWAVRWRRPVRLRHGVRCLPTVAGGWGARGTGGMFTDIAWPRPTAHEISCPRPRRHLPRQVLSVEPGGFVPVTHGHRSARRHEHAAHRQSGSRDRAGTSAVVAASADGVPRTRLPLGHRRYLGCLSSRRWWARLGS